MFFIHFRVISITSFALEALGIRTLKVWLEFGTITTLLLLFLLFKFKAFLLSLLLFKFKAFLLFNAIAFTLAFFLFNFWSCSFLLFYITAKSTACEYNVCSHPAYAGWQRTVGQRPTIPVRWSLFSFAFLCTPYYTFHCSYIRSYATLYHLYFYNLHTFAIIRLCFAP